MKTTKIEKKGLGEIRIGPVMFEGPLKVRVSGAFIPDFTVDLTRPPKFSILSIIRPKITFLVGTEAYEVSLEGGLRKADPGIFDRPTWFDALNELGIISVIGASILVGYLVWRMVR
jgi:hypothetical protein